ncbi:hypothetical protein [Lysinibacillus xylanilyticus]
MVAASIKLIDELYEKRDSEEFSGDCERFEDYAEFEAYVLKRMANELGNS